MRRILAVVAFVFLFAAAAAQPALADKPVREALLPALDYVDTASCAFPVSVDFTFDRGYITTFSNGDAIITGALKATLTNTVTGESINVSIPGPTKMTVNADGSMTLMVTGRIATPLLNGTLTLFSGRLFEPIYGSHDVTLSGRAVDLCALLAP